MICSFPQNITASSLQGDVEKRSCALNISATDYARNLVTGETSGLFPYG